MNLFVLKPIKGEKWKAGDIVNVNRQYAKKLINAGYASDKKPTETPAQKTAK
jgi:hypothetical protein